MSESQAPHTPPTPPADPPRPRRRWLGPIVAFLVALQVVFRVVPEFRPGPIGLLCWLFGLELVPLAALIVLGVAVLAALFRRPFWTRRRFALWSLLALVVLSPISFRRYPSSFDGRPSRVEFRLPLDGPITVGWGGDTPAQNYHVRAPDQTSAYDLLVTVDGATHKGEGKRVDDYYIYGRTILAPADGEVVATYDADPDMAVGELGGGKIAAGNHVVLKVAPDEYVWICHIKPGSVAVKRGDPVRRGDPIGQVGNSGNTSEPHLHIHLQSTPEAHLGEGIPLLFSHYRTADGRHVDRGVPTGGITPDGRFAGQVVTHDPPSVAPNAAPAPAADPELETTPAP